jgi:hypothetical protein
MTRIFITQFVLIMDSLKELVYVINRNKVKQIDILDLSKSEDPTKVNQLYQAISSGAIETDDDAFQLLYAEEGSRSAYSNLKRVLKEKLKNTIFFIDAYRKEHTDRQTAFFQLQRDFAAAQLFLAKNATGPAIELLEDILKSAEEYEFTDLCLFTCRHLSLHHATRSGDEKKYTHFYNLWKKYSDLEVWERKAEFYYSDLVIHYVNNKTTKKGLQKLAGEFYLELSRKVPEIDSYTFRFFTALIHLFSYTCVNDYISTFSICEETIRFFEKKNFSANTPIQICLHHQLVACMQSRDYQRGKMIAQHSDRLLEEGSFNWFKNLEYLLLLALHTANYQEAYQVFNNAVNNRRFEFLPENIAEFWNLYRAYLHLLIDMGKIQPDPEDNQFTSFRINRFLNDMPVYAKDKRGMNIAILTAQILFYIQQRKYDTAIDRMDAIKKYCSRYLFKADTLRSYYFIKLLLAIPQGSFHQHAVMRHAEPHLKKLESISTEISHQYHKIEIIPYEALWQLTLASLGNLVVRSSKVKKARLRFQPDRSMEQ